MFEWLQNSGLVGSADPIDPQPVVADDGTLASILGISPAELQQQIMSATGGLAAEEPSLAELLADTAMTVVGRDAMTAEPLTGALPEWAKDISPKALKNPDFDPYLGVVSQTGDERVYMETKTVPAKPADAPLAEGMEQPQTSGDLEFRSGGQRPPEDVQTPGEDKPKAKRKDKTLSLTQALNDPYTWDEEQIAEAMKKMRQAGIPVDSFDMGSTSLVSVWGSLVQRAAMTYSLSSGQRKVSPWDVLDMYKSEAKAAGTWQDLDGKYSRTTVQRTVSDITEGEAWSVLRSNVSQLLGRDPSDQEVRDFTYRMNQLAAANPSISKTITKYKNGEAVSSNTNTTGGFTGADAEQAAYDQAQNDPDYAEYQASTTYFNAAMAALDAIGDA